MFRPLLQTRPDFAFFLARVALGASLLPHGLAKVGITFDGSPDIQGGLDGTVQFFQNTFGLPPALTYAAIAVEILASLCLIFGFFGRIAALSVAGTMGVAAWKTLEGLAGDGTVALEHVKTWWYDNPAMQTTYGSYHLLAIGVGLAIVIRGSGWLSIDRALSKGPAL